MTDWDPRTNGTLRGFLIILAVAAAITASGQAGVVGLGLVFLILRIAFIVAIGYFIFRFWRANREEISMWPRRAQAVFYGGGVLALVDLVASVATRFPVGGLQALVFFFVLVAAGFSMWRVWRDQHTYGY